MNQYQTIAIQNPCRLGCETADPQFAYLFPPGSIVLSVNSGYE